MNGAILIENRGDKNLMVRHAEATGKFIPDSWGLEVWDHLDIKSLHDYNRILTSKEFWKEVPFEKVLIFQMDSTLLRPGIEEFLKYDYVGAPWKFQNHGGNGGLSLRTKDVMLDIIDSNPYKGEAPHGYEDVYFSNMLLTGKYGKLAPREVCKQFSCESIFELGTLGYHAIDKYLSYHECEMIKTQY